MFNAIEQFSQAHQHTIAAIGAISTSAAVVVSLVLIAQRTNRTRIKAHASVSFIDHVTLKGKPKPEYITVMIANLGLMPVVIPAFFHWKFPFKDVYWVVNPWDSVQHDPRVPDRQYPVEIRPRHSQTFFVTEMSTFKETTSDMFVRACLSRWSARFIKAIVVTDDAKIFKVKLDRSLRRELAATRRSTTKGKNERGALGLVR